MKLFRQPADRQAEQNPADAHDEKLSARFASENVPVATAATAKR